MAVFPGHFVSGAGRLCVLESQPGQRCNPPVPGTTSQVSDVSSDELDIREPAPSRFVTFKHAILSTLADLPFKLISYRNPS